MRVRKLIVGAVGVVLVIGIGAALALRALLDPQMLAHAIEGQATAWLERPVHIGAARAHVFPTPRITLTTVGVDGPQALTADEASPPHLATPSNVTLAPVARFLPIPCPSITAAPSA